MATINLSGHLQFNDGTTVEKKETVFAINKELDVYGGFDHMILSYDIPNEDPEEIFGEIFNEYRMTAPQAIEMADMMIGWWQQFKQKMQTQGLQLDKRG